jgi:anhydro-N-acetylmuramic acid kinase
MKPFYTTEQMQRPRRVIGLMSGTSVDGIDAAAVEIAGVGDDIAPRLVAFASVPFDPAVREAVLAAFGAGSNAAALTALHAALGLIFADAVVEARAAAGWTRGMVDAIGSHGQTIWHQPDPVEIGGMFVSATLQLGDPATIAERTGAPVVSDFRARDMAAGGQGAPLVPLVDWLLYRDAAHARALQNIGGIGNMTWLPAGGDVESVVAFDTGPGNMVIDAAAAILTAGTARFDEDGRMALAGTVSGAALELLLSHPYLSQPPPKSTGREVFGVEYTQRVVAEMQAGGLGWEDIMATLTAFTAESIARAYRDFLPGTPAEVIVGGGGARNPALTAEIRRRLDVPLVTNEDLGWNGDAKEAVAFAILADRTMQGLYGNVPAATGAARRVVLGSVTPGAA